MSAETAATPADDQHEYTMRLSLNVLDHLGLNLYSNIPAVISEVVANAWDADANLVKIDIDKTAGTITVSDDGIGMTAADLNDRFLYIGYRRREDGKAKSPSGRHVMGRKGIGKLSLFAIADEIHVETTKGGARAGLVLEATKIREQMKSAKKEDDYHPIPLDPAAITATKGTTITLSQLRLNPTESTLINLRRRLARRFSIIGPENKFGVEVNGDEISVTDRDFYPKIEYLWSLGNTGDEYEKLCTKAKNKQHITGDIDNSKGWVVTGWVGTVDEQKSIDEETNIIPVLAWGKLIHEDLLSAVKATGVYSKYVMGEIHADFVDTDDDDDIATSDRQSLKESDPRFDALTTYLKDVVLKKVSTEWLTWRRNNALDKAIQNPVVKEWYDGLKGDAKPYAKQLFGKIGDMSLENESDRLELYKNCILAFEKLRYRNELSKLDALDDASQLDVIGSAFASIDEIEAAQYGEIARGRVRVIEAFKGLVDTDARERVVQSHLFDHLWLLDTSWERAATNPHIEERVTTEFDKITDGLTPEEKAGRIDIRYRTAAGKHIIIELKRYSVKVTVGELVDQLGKYHTALRKCLEDHFPKMPREIECIAVLGEPPHNVTPEQVRRSLAGIGARVVTYDDLVRTALDSYEEYLAAHAQVSQLADLIDRLENSAGIAPNDGDGDGDGGSSP